MVVVVVEEEEEQEEVAAPRLLARAFERLNESSVGTHPCLAAGSPGRGGEARTHPRRHAATAMSITETGERSFATASDRTARARGGRRLSPPAPVA